MFANHILKHCKYTDGSDETKIENKVLMHYVFRLTLNPIKSPPQLEATIKSSYCFVPEQPNCLTPAIFHTNVFSTPFILLKAEKICVFSSPRKSQGGTLDV